MRYSIFAMQVVKPLVSGDPLYRRLHDLVSSAPQAGSYAAKNRYYGRVCSALQESAGTFQQGVWDYWDDPSRAPGDFQDWVDGLKGKEARKQPAPSSEQRYLVFTLSLLLQNGSTSDQRLLQHCNIPESKLWRRDTFAHLLRGIPQVNFLHVQSDLVYLLPGDDPDYGPTRADLSNGDYHYLRELD
jgi:hypothetical protein